MITETERKKLSRVCAQYNTGIRKVFILGERRCSLINNGNAVWLGFEDMDNGGIRYEALAEVTPDAIMATINLFEIKQVMES